MESVATSTEQTDNDADVLKGGIICFKFYGPTHLAKDSKQGYSEMMINWAQRFCHKIQCFWYNKIGQISSKCLEKDSREQTLVPVFSPSK